MAFSAHKFSLFISGTLIIGCTRRQRSGCLVAKSGGSICVFRSLGAGRGVSSSFISSSHLVSFTARLPAENATAWVAETAQMDVLTVWRLPTWKSTLRVLAEFGSGKASLLSLQTAAFLLCS